MNDWYDAEQRVEKAQELFAQQKWQEALEELRAAIALNPYNSAWYFNVGLTLDELQRYQEAIEAYRAALKICPDDLEALYRVGVDLTRLGLFRQAIASFDQIETLDPAFEPAYCGRILAYSELEEHQKAEEMFYLARQFKEDCPQCYYHIAASLARRQRFDKAIYCWQKTLDLDESFPQIHLRLAEAHRQKAELEKARQHYLHELRLNPGHTHALLELGTLLEQMGRIAEAGEKFRRAIELAPHQPAVYLHYARWLLRGHHPDPAPEPFASPRGAGSSVSGLEHPTLQAAWNALARALNLDPRHPGVHLAMAQVCLGQRDFAEARRHLRRELALKPEDPQLLLELANLLMDCGQDRPAAACLRRLLARQPHHPAAWANLAVAHFHCRRYDQGIAACQEALKASADPCLSHAPGDPAEDPPPPPMPPALAPGRASPQFTAMYNLALAYMRMGDYPQAMDWLNRLKKGTAQREKGGRPKPPGGPWPAPADPALAPLELRLRLLLGWDWLLRKFRLR